MQRILSSAVLFLFALTILMPKQAFAVGSSGFENASYSAKTLGQANAVIARPQDPSTISFNPAGMMELPGVQVSAGLQNLDWRIFHRNNATGDHTQSDARLILLPSLYATVNPGNMPGEFLDNRLAFGVGVNSPFGLQNSFPARDPFGDVGYDNRLKLAATTIGGAFQATDWLSVGSGAIYYNAFDYGQEFSYPNAAVLGVAADDGEAKVDSTGHAWGWNFGILAKWREAHKFAFSFRSGANLKMKGTAKIEGIVLGAAQGFPTFPNFETGITTDIPLPFNMTGGYAYEPSDQWAAEFDVGYTDWSQFADQDYEFDNPTAVLRALGTIPRNYDDTWSFHLGGHRRWNPKIDLYGGFAFYTAASPKKHVDNFLPDANRYLWTAGSTYSITNWMDIDCSYLFMLLGSRHISNPQALARAGINIDGRYTSIIHGAFITVTMRFDSPFAEKGAVESAAVTQ